MSTTLDLPLPFCSLFIPRTLYTCHYLTSFLTPRHFISHPIISARTHLSSFLFLLSSFCPIPLSSSFFVISIPQLARTTIFSTFCQQQPSCLLPFFPPLKLFLLCRLVLPPTHLFDSKFELNHFQSQPSELHGSIDPKTPHFFYIGLYK